MPFLPQRFYSLGVLFLWPVQIIGELFFYFEVNLIRREENEESKS
jgi:hypothetical protein